MRARFPYRSKAFDVGLRFVRFAKTTGQCQKKRYPILTSNSRANWQSVWESAS
jgi:hypothetical protein